MVADLQICEAERFVPSSELATNRNLDNTSNVGRSEPDLFVAFLLLEMERATAVGSSHFGAASSQEIVFSSVEKLNYVDTSTLDWTEPPAESETLVDDMVDSFIREKKPIKLHLRVKGQLHTKFIVDTLVDPYD